MAGRMFRIGLKWVNLSMVTQIEEHPGRSWGYSEDEKQPSIFIHLLGGDGFAVVASEAVAAGYPDMATCEDALIFAMDAYHG